MEFGVQFFPSVGPDQKSAEQYWDEALKLTKLAEQLGYTNVARSSITLTPMAAIARTR